LSRNAVTDGIPSASTSQASLASPRGEIVVRPVTTLTEFRACVALQEEVWGPDWTDTVPASLLQAATYVGGIVLGAFTAAGDLAGFLFGLTGVDNGEVSHWSHLLGVSPGTRDMGVGRMLKEAQRAELALRNVRSMSWSFDPLVAKNAHLNLNRLGAHVVRYVPDMYGTTSSPLHYGVATDRLVVRVDTMATRLPSPPPVEAMDAPVLGLAPETREAIARHALPPAVRIEIPADIRLILETSPAEAAAWRGAVRGNFEWALGNSYEVAGLYREPVSSRSYYTLVRHAA
jgi:chorismate synthase